MCAPKVSKVFTENYMVELCFTLFMKSPHGMSTSFVIRYECIYFFSMQQGMMFFFIGITMAAVQGIIIQLFHSVVRLLCRQEYRYS